MCLVSCRSSTQPEPETVVAARPVQPLPSTWAHRTQAVPLYEHAPAPAQYRDSLQAGIASDADRARRQSEVVIVQEPRASGTVVGGGASPRGSGSLAVERRRSRTQFEPRRSDGLGGENVLPTRKYSKGGSAMGIKGPRTSNTSFSSKRERIMIVDGNGVRKEYFR